MTDVNLLAEIPVDATSQYVRNTRARRFVQDVMHNLPHANVGFVVAVETAGEDALEVKPVLLGSDELTNRDLERGEVTVQVTLKIPVGHRFDQPRKHLRELDADIRKDGKEAQEKNREENTLALIAEVDRTMAAARKAQEDADEAFSRARRAGLYR